MKKEKKKNSTGGAGYKTYSANLKKKKNGQ